MYVKGTQFYTNPSNTQNRIDALESLLQGNLDPLPVAVSPLFSDEQTHSDLKKKSLYFQRQKIKLKFITLKMIPSQLFNGSIPII